MKKVLIGLILILLFLSQFTLAETLTVDTKIGSYIYSDADATEPYRSTGISFNGLSMPVGVRAIYNVYNGIGFTGALSNYRIGLQINKDFSLIDKVTLTPYVGGSLSSSSLLSGSLSFDAGFSSKANMSIFGFIDPVLGADLASFSDIYIFEYNAGFEMGLISSLKLTVLYAGLLANNGHMIGYGGKLSYSF